MATKFPKAEALMAEPNEALAALLERVTEQAASETDPAAVVHGSYYVEDEGSIIAIQAAQGAAPTMAAIAAKSDAVAPDPAVLANAVTLQDRAAQAIANLQASYDGWSGLTAAQKDAAQKLTIRVVIALARLVLRRLDAV